MTVSAFGSFFYEALPNPKSSYQAEVVELSSKQEYGFRMTQMQLKASFSPLPYREDQRGPRKRKLTRTALFGRTDRVLNPKLACFVSGITIPRVLVAVRVGGAVRVGSGKLPNWIHIHAWFICLLLWLRWSGLSLSA